MKLTQTSYLALLLAGTISMGAVPAFAEHGGPHGGPGGHGPGGPRFFEESDTNKDGFLTKDEMSAAQSKRLDEMFTNVDTDKDGKLSKEELQKGHEAMRQKMRERFGKRGERPDARPEAPKAAE